MTSMRLLVRRPGARLAEGIVTHIQRVPVDVPTARRQWDSYVSAFATAGWQIVEAPPADDSPDAVFVEDTVLVFRGHAVMAHPGAPGRRSEVPAVEALVASLGLPVHHVRPPGTFDGGDALKVDGTVYVGLGGRTNAEGLRQLRILLEPLGAEVVAVPVGRVLHLKSAVTALPDGTVVGYPPLVADRSAFSRFRTVPEPSGAHVVLLDDDTVLMAADAPRSAEAFRDLGYRTVCVDIGEFQKLEACVTCLSVRLRG